MDQVRAYVLDRLAPVLSRSDRPSRKFATSPTKPGNAALQRSFALAMTFVPGEIKVQACCTKGASLPRNRLGRSLFAHRSEHLLRLLLGSSGMFGFFFKTVSQGIVFHRQLVQSLRHRLIANQLGSAPIVKGFRA